MTLTLASPCTAVKDSGWSMRMCDFVPLNAALPVSCPYWYEHPAHPPDLQTCDPAHPDVLLLASSAVRGQIHCYFSTYESKTWINTDLRKPMVFYDLVRECPLYGPVEGHLWYSNKVHSVTKQKHVIFRRCRWYSNRFNIVIWMSLVSQVSFHSWWNSVKASSHLIRLVPILGASAVEHICH